MFVTIDDRTYIISNLHWKQTLHGSKRRNCACRATRRQKGKFCMSWFRKAVAGATTGAVLFGFCFGFGLNPGYAQVGQRTTTPSTETSRQLELLGRVLDIVRSDYVDKPDDSKLVTAAIDG